jgi:hypothetical protein
MFMKLMRILSLPVVGTATVLALVFTASPALAQSVQPVGLPVGVYVAATGGALLSPNTTGAFGAEFGDRIHPHVVAYATLTYFEDLMDSSVSDQLASASRTLTSVTGRSWNLQGRDRGVGFVAGGKYLITRGSVRPYVGGGLGALGLRRFVTDARAGDVTLATFNDLNIGDRALTDKTVVRPLGEAAFGVDFEFGRTHSELGYRYRHAFNLTNTPDFSQVVAAIGINW